MRRVCARCLLQGKLFMSILTDATLLTADAHPVEHVTESSPAMTRAVTDIEVPLSSSFHRNASYVLSMNYLTLETLND